jgi:pimeloyl-ACP methyl ester carboxylesterase
MTRARLNGIEIDYEVSGRGPAVLLSHGYSATRRMWDDQHRALVICDSGPGYRNADARRQWNERAQERAVALETRGLAALGQSREVRESASLHRSAQGLAHAARGMLAQEGSRVIDGLGAIDVPTLIIVGDKDQPFIAPCEYMAKKISGARLEVIRDAGHSSNLDQPEAFNRVLRDFLDGLPA